MSKRETVMYEVEVVKFAKNKDELKDIFRNLIREIDDIAKRFKDKGWKIQAVAGLSNTKGKIWACDSGIKKLIHTGKSGRPQKVIEKSIIVDSKFGTGIWKLDWHIHCMILCNPGYTAREEIRKRLHKNIFNNEKDRLFVKPCDISFESYIINQSEDVIFCDTGDWEYTFRDYYFEHFKEQSANSKYRRTMTDKAEQICKKELEKIQPRLLAMKHYFKQYCDSYNNKKKKKNYNHKH